MCLRALVWGVDISGWGGMVSAWPIHLTLPGWLQEHTAPCLTGSEFGLGKYSHCCYWISEEETVTVGREAGGRRVRWALWKSHYKGRNWRNAGTCMGRRSGSVTHPKTGPRGWEQMRGLNLWPTPTLGLPHGKQRSLCRFVFRLRPLETHTWWLVDSPSAMEASMWLRLPPCPCTSQCHHSFASRLGACSRRSSSFGLASTQVDKTDGLMVQAWRQVILGSIPMSKAFRNLDIER